MSAFTDKAEHDIPYQQKCFPGRTVMNANVERTTIRKVYLRLLPLSLAPMRFHTVWTHNRHQPLDCLPNPSLSAAFIAANVPLAQ
jgi:hypothetical protein